MFQTAIEQIKAWAKEHEEHKQEDQETRSPLFRSPISFIPALLLMLWCICALFFGLYTFDPTYAINYPRVAAFFGLVYLAGKEYFLLEKDIEARKK